MDSFVPRPETGLSLAALSATGTVVLVPGDDDASAGLGGLGGTGKTHLAASLALSYHHSHTADLVLWVNATGRDAVVSGYAEALHDMGEPDRGEGMEHAAARFRDWLARTERPWLVVLDDLADAGAVDGLWPHGVAGRVLVTTRRPDLAVLADRAHRARVGVFNPREAMAYLAAKLRSDPGQRAGALDLARDLGFVPLTLGHAGSYMAATGLDCREYSSRLDERRSAVASPAGATESVVVAAWSLSVELADQLPPRGLAGRTLALAALLGPAGIPAAVLTSPAACAYITGEAEASVDALAAVRAAVYNLERAGLLTIDSASAARTVAVHAVVQALTAQNQPTAEREATARVAADALAQAWSGPDVPPDVAQALREGTARLRGASRTALWRPQFHPVLMQAGLSLGRSGLAGPAVSYWQELFRTSQQVLGPDHDQTRRALDRLAAARGESGDHTEAIAIYEARLAESELSHGPEDPATMSVRETLARAYLAAGRADDAVHLAQQALVTTEQAHGREHPDSLAAQETLARSYFEAGQFGDAAAELRHVLAGREEALGPRHLETIAARDALAAAYRQAGRAKEALDLSKRTLADREQVQGPDHLETIAARAGLAAAYLAAAKPKDAAKLYQRVLADRERVQGPDHPDTIAARSDLALAYEATNKLAYAVREYERAAGAAERVLGPDHPLTRQTKQNLNACARNAIAKLGIDLRSAPNR